jgi:integrase
MKRRDYGEGNIEARGSDKWRLRYRVNGKRHKATFHGTRVEAQRELRRLLKSADDGTHVAPNRITLKDWSEQWLTLLARGEANGTRRRGLVSARTRERYRELLALYVLPVLGERPIQQLTATEIDALYISIERRLSVTTVRHVHIALRSSLASAQRKIGLNKNPCDAADVPAPEETATGQALEPADLKRLIDSFRGSVLHPMVATAASTGVRLGELLALRWSDLDPVAKTLRVERAIEQTTQHGRLLKEPKTKRGKRTITIDDALVTMLLNERDKHLRLVAGIADGALVYLSLIRLPTEALMFPSPTMEGGKLDLMRLRNPKSVTKETRKRFRKLGFASFRFHDLRASHGTALLDAGVPVHVVAARLGHDPAVLLKTYAKRTKTADTSAAAVIGALLKGIL